MMLTAKTEDRGSRLSERALELEIDAQKNVAAMMEEAKEKGLPVVRYDASLKKCYLEYRDESRNDDCSNLNTGNIPNR